MTYIPPQDSPVKPAVRSDGPEHIGTIARRVVVNAAKTAIAHWSKIAERTRGLERSHALAQEEFFTDRLAELEGRPVGGAEDVAA